MEHAIKDRRMKHTIKGTIKGGRMKRTIKGGRMKRTRKGGFTIKGRRLKLTIKGGFTIKGRRRKHTINNRMTQHTWMKHTIKGTNKDRRMKQSIKDTIKGRRVKHTIKDTIKGRRMKDTIKCSFTIKGRRMKHTIKRSFRSNFVCQDIVTETLSRLPVKDLLRFKCVCKGWRDLIESSEFITLHHNKMSTKRKSLIVSSLHKPVVSTFSSNNLEVSRYVDFPIFENKKNPKRLGCFCGPYNGVWCLYDQESSQGSTICDDDEYSSVGNNIALWNPATRELKALPKSRTRNSHLYFWLEVNVGFGYDKNTNDYKVVKISEYSNLSSRYTSSSTYTWIEMYTLSNDSWREIETMVPIRIKNAQNSSSTSLKGIQYWLSYNDAILSFNISDEVFETIELPMPQENLETMRKFKKLLVLHDSLALIVRFGDHYVGQEERFEVWKLKENNGVVKSWTKVSTIRPHSNFCPRELNGFWEDGNAVMVNFDTQLMLYDLETHGTKWTRNYDDDVNLNPFGNPYFLMYFFVESLVSVRGGERLTTPSSFRKLACYDDILSVLEYV